MAPRTISRGEKELIVTIAQNGYTPQEIAEMATMGVSTEYRILALFRNTGVVERT